MTIIGFPTDVRILRRLVRDNLFGQRQRHDTDVAQGQGRGREHLSARRLDVMVNTALAYDAVLKPYADPLLAAIG